jgi:hypothetical protein
MIQAATQQARREVRPWLVAIALVVLLALFTR